MKQQLVILQRFLCLGSGRLIRGTHLYGLGSLADYLTWRRFELVLFLGRVDVRSTTRFVALDRLLLLEGAIKLAYPWLKVEVSQ